MSAITEANRKWWTLGALSFALFMVLLDNTVVTVALPAIRSDLGSGLSALEWVVNAYAITFSVLLLTGGKLADFLGRRLIFMLGLGIFTVMSLFCALAPSSTVLILARAGQGFGAALMLPAALAILSATFPVRERGLALGVFSAISGGALAIGPLVGGLLVDGADWRWIFYVNIPVGVIGIAFGRVVMRESRDSSVEQRLDLPGLITSGAAIFALTFALIEAHRYGWTSATIVLCFVGAAVGLAAFAALELRQRLPLLDLAQFRNRNYAGGNLVGMLVFLSLFGLVFYMSIFLQSVLGYTATEAGATFLSNTIAIMIAAPISGSVSDRIGARAPMAVGLTLFGTALLFLSRVDSGTGFWDMFPWLVVGGVGFGIVMPPLTAVVLDAVPVEKSGVASGVLQSFRQFGAAMGVAIMGTFVVTQVGDLAPGQPGFAREFVVGLQDLLVASGIVALAAAAVVLVLIRRPEDVGTVDEVALSAESQSG